MFSAAILRPLTETRNYARLSLPKKQKAEGDSEEVCDKEETVPIVVSCGVKAEAPGSGLAGRLRSRTGACYVFGLFGWMDGVTCACHRRPSAEREGARAASAARAAIAADLYQDKRMSRSQTGVSEGFIGLILSGLM